jgi:hypothetical protein
LCEFTQSFGDDDDDQHHHHHTTAAAPTATTFNSFLFRLSVASVTLSLPKEDVPF